MKKSSNKLLPWQILKERLEFKETEAAMEIKLKDGLASTGQVDGEPNTQ